MVYYQLKSQSLFFFLPAIHILLHSVSKYRGGEGVAVVVTPGNAQWKEQQQNHTVDVLILWGE